MPGKLISPEHAHQQIDFSGLQYGNCTPSNIDGCLQHGNAVVFMEYKLTGSNMPNGQRIMYETLVDFLEKGGCRAAALLAYHENLWNEGEIDGAGSPVAAMYFQGHWVRPESATVKDVVNALLYSE